MNRLKNSFVLKSFRIYIILQLMIFFFLACNREYSRERIIKMNQLSIVNDVNSFRRDSLSQKLSPQHYIKNLLTYKYNLLIQFKKNDSLYIKEIDSLLNLYPNSSLASINNFIKACLLSKSNKVEASKLLLESIKSFESNKDTLGLIFIYRELYFYNGNSSGMLIGNEKLKRLYSDKVVELGQKSSHPLGKAMHYFFCIIQKSDYPNPKDEAYVLSCYNEANKLIDNNPNIDFYKEYIATVTTSWYFKFDRYDEIRKIFKSTMENTKSKLSHTPTYCLSVLSYFENDYNESLRLMKISDSIYQASANKDLEVDTKFAKHYVNLFRRLKFDKDSIINRLIVRDSLVDQYNDINRKKSILELQSQYQDEKKELEIKRKNQMFNYLSLFTIFTIISLVVISVSFYINKKNKDKLASEIQMKEDIQRVISHDMLSPLIALEGMVNRNIMHLANDMGGKSNQEILSDLTVQQNYLQTAKLLCQNIVNWLWTDKQSKTENESIDFTKNVEYTVASLRSFSKLNDCTIEVDSSLPPNEACNIDYNAFNVVLRNLLTNVMRHSKATQIRIHISSDLKYKEVRIYDNGEAIDPEFKQELQDYLNGANQDSFGGLGLYLVKTFLAKIKGTYRFESSTDSEFTQFQTIRIKI